MNNVSEDIMLLVIWPFFYVIKPQGDAFNESAPDQTALPSKSLIKTKAKEKKRPNALSCLNIFQLQLIPQSKW